MIKTIENCPLCNCKEPIVIEKTPFVLLSKLWMVFLKIDINNYGSVTEIKLNKCLTCGLLYFTPQLIGDEVLYAKLQNIKGYYLEEKAEFIIGLKYISQNNNVLEIGPGNGAFARRLQCQTYTGLELSDKAIRMANLLGLQPKFKMLRQSIEEHAINNKEKYDIVCAFQVMEHVSAVRSFIESSIICLKKGGKLIISVPSEDSFIGFATNDIWNAPPHHLTRWTDECLKQLTSHFNLKIIKIEHDKLSDYHCGLYSVCLIQKFIRNIFHLKQKRYDYRFAFLPVRLAIRILSLLPEIIYKFIKIRPQGHTVTIVFEKG